MFSVDIVECFALLCCAQCFMAVLCYVCVHSSEQLCCVICRSAMLLGRLCCALVCLAVLCCALLCAGVGEQYPTEKKYVAGQENVTTQDARNIQKSYNLDGILSQFYGL